MKVTIDGREYQGATAVALIEEVKDLHWGATPNMDAEAYIALQAGTYKRMIEKEMELPQSDTEMRARAMFKAIAEIGAWDFKEE
jgi:hypothetical protein